MKIYYIKAATKDKSQGLRAYDEEISAVGGSLLEWVEKHSIPRNMIWYADMYELDSDTKSIIHIGELDPTCKGYVFRTPRRQINPYKRRFRPLKYLFKQYN